MQEATHQIEESSKEIKLTEKQLQNFWNRVNKTESCWLWTGETIKMGYGRLSISTKHYLAHRMSWMMHRGPIPKGEGYHGICVLHKCDVPGCVNPDHLFLGTNQDNVDDKARKGRCNSPSGERHGTRTHPERMPRGEANGASKLTEEQVLQIRSIHANGEKSQYKIAEDFGGSTSLISYIIRGIKWKHLTPVPSGCA